MTFADLTPQELVDLVADGDWMNLTIEQAQRAHEMLQAHGQAVLQMEAALEDEVRRMIAQGAPA